MDSHFQEGLKAGSGHPRSRAAELKGLYAGAESSAIAFQVLATQGTSYTAFSIASGAAATHRTRDIIQVAKGPVNLLLLSDQRWTLCFFERSLKSQKPEFGEETPRTRGEGGNKEGSSHRVLFLLRVRWTSEGEKPYLDLFRGAGPLKAVKYQSQCDNHGLGNAALLKTVKGEELCWD